MPRHPLLAASTVALLLAGVAPGKADSYFFRSKPAVEPPVAFEFSPETAAVPGTSAVSETIRLKGYRNRTASVSGGSFQICAAPDCSDQGSTWRTQPLADLPADAYARLRVEPAAFGAQASATLTVGGSSATFVATSRAKDETPRAIAFASLKDQTEGAVLTSQPQQLVEHDGVALSVTGTTASYRVCSDESCSVATQFTSSPGTARQGEWVQLRQTAPTAGAPQVATLRYGTLTSTWSVESKPSVATCPGAYMRVKTQYGFEALFCGWTAAPTLTSVYLGNSEGYQLWMHTSKQYSCGGWGVSMMVVGQVGVATSLGANGGGGGSSACSGKLPDEQVWRDGSGQAAPVTVIILSKGTMPPTFSSVPASALTWSNR